MLLTLVLASAAAAFQDVDVWIKEGDDLLDRTNAKAALLKFEKVITTAPDRVEGYIGRARSLEILAILEDAENDLTRALELDPANGLALFFRGRVRGRRGDHSGALADLDRCRERGIRDPKVFSLKGLSLNRLNRSAEAEEQFSRALSEGEPDEVAYSGRAWARMEQGNLRGVLSDETRSLELDPSDAKDYLRRAMAYYSLESWENALRDLRKAAELKDGYREWLAHWIFQTRSKMGSRDEALQELREFSKARADGWAVPWMAKVTAYDLGELSEEKLLEAAGEDSERGTAHLAIGLRRLLEGKTDEALERFRKVVQLPRSTGGYDFVLATEEIRRQLRVRLDRIVTELEAKVRKLPLFEATYDVDMPWAPDAEMALKTILWTADMKRKEAFLLLRGKNLPKKSDVTMSLHVQDLQMYAWENSSDGYHRMDFSFMSKLETEIEADVARVLPPAPDAKPEADDSIPSLTLFLEGKPSKEGEGTFRFTSGISSHPCGWLQELPGPEDNFRESEDEIVFEFRAQRKKVIIDRKTGLLRSLETLDFDGTKRTIRLVSYKPLGSWPNLGRPGKEKPLPFDMARFRNQMIQQENLLVGTVGAILERWDEVVKAGKADPAAAILTRWAAQYTDGMYAYAVRALAARRIQEAMDQGTPVSTLLKDAEADSRRFAARMAEERKGVDEFLKSGLAELAERTENGLFEWPIDSRRHAAARTLIKKGLDPQAVERQRKTTFGDRLEQLYLEELRTRTQL